MDTGDEVVSPAPAGPAPLPRGAAPAGVRAASPPAPPPAPGKPTPEAVLRWIAAAGAGLWFPSAHAKQADVSRDSLDDPLNELRAAGLVRVAAWVKGAGQGYALTAEGEAVATGTPAPRKPDPAADPADPPAASPADALLDRRPPVATPALLLANIIWFFVGLVVASRLGVPLGRYLTDGNPGVLARLGALSADALLRGEWWRLVTCCFVHAVWWHALSNLVNLGMVGSLAELLWGRWRVLVVYLLAGLGGSCLAMALRPADPATGVVVALNGASGAVWGVSTSLLVWFLLFRTSLRPDLASEFARRLGLAFAVNAALSLVPGISWEAHAGGALVGFVAAGLLNALRFGDRPRRRAAAALLALVPVASVGGLVAAMTWGEPWAALRRPPVPRVIYHVTTNPDAARRAAVLRAAVVFNQTVAPFVADLHPAAVRPVEDAAARLLVTNPARRPAEVAAARARVADLKARADKVVQLTTVPTGIEGLDQHRARVWAFADARVRSFDRLLGLLDANAIPPVAASQAWAASRHWADRLWLDLGPVVVRTSPPAP